MKRAERAFLAVLLAAGVQLAPGMLHSASAADQRMQAFERGLRPAIEVDGEPQVRWTIEQRMAHHKVPGASIAVIRGGRLAWAKAYGLKQAGAQDRIDAETVFSVGSLSKVGTAFAVLRLVDTGRLDLDADVNSYLKQWQVVENAYTAVSPVTLRGLLSHSAGLNVDGFPDFQPHEALPSALDTLEGRPPAKTEAVRVVYFPGSEVRYSGGGTTIAQLAIEEVTGKNFPTAARTLVFGPLGMARSTYENPLPAAYGNIARAHDGEGRPAALPRGWESFAEMAASGLWSTPSDYARLVIAAMEAYRGADHSLLSGPLAREIMTEVGPSPFGLGPQLAGAGERRRFMHSGSNESYKAWMEGHLSTGNGVVIFTNGANGTALIRDIRRAIAHAEAWSLELTARTSPNILPASELNELVGIYENERTANLGARRAMPDMPAHAVWMKAGELYLGPAGAKEDEGHKLWPQSRTRFIMDVGYLGSVELLTPVEFVRGYDGRVEGLLIHHGEHVLEARKISAHELAQSN